MFQMNTNVNFIFDELLLSFQQTFRAYTNKLSHDVVLMNVLSVVSCYEMLARRMCHLIFNDQFNMFRAKEETKHTKSDFICLQQGCTTFSLLPVALHLLL